MVIYRDCRHLLCSLWLALGGCQGPPAQESAAEETGLLASSQIKPTPPLGRAALDPLPRQGARLSAQEAYFRSSRSPAASAKAKALGPSGKPQGAGTIDVQAGAIAHLRLHLAEGDTVLAETRSLSRGADPVLHLWSRAERKEVARDDDSGAEPGAARLSYTALAAGTFVLFVRAYSHLDDGLCDLVVNGRVRLRQLKLGGSVVAVSATAGKTTLQTVLLNDGQGSEPWPPLTRACSDTLLFLLDAQSGELLAADDDSGVELGSHLALTRSPAWVVVGAYSGADEGATRLVVNDAGRGDADGDKLGDGLEQALCLCGSATGSACGFDCTKVVSAQDTDGDGLSDAEEVLGIDDTFFPQLLPRWGAQARHKDLFVEVDLAAWEDLNVSPSVSHSGRLPTAVEAHRAARVYARLTKMNNPDGTDGIRLHLDVGGACGSLASGIDEVCGALCAHGVDGTRRCGQSLFAGPPANRRLSLSPARLHRFHQALSDCVVSGSAPVLSDNLEYDCDRITAMVHELGHNLGLGRHYGTPETGGGNCKPNYPSLMNYAYSDRFYGGQEVRFSEGELVGTGDLDPTDIDETVPYGGATADVGWLATAPFYYTLHDCLQLGRGCKVDFNRDGKLDSSVRVYLSPMPNYGWICENVHGNALDSENIDDLVVTRGVAGAQMSLKKSDGTLAPSLVVVAAATSQGTTRLHENHTFATFGSWAGWTSLGGPVWRSDTQPAAVTLAEGATERIWIFACTDGADPVRYATLDASGKVSSWQKVPGQPATLRTREVSAALRGGDLLLVLRDESDGGDRLYLTRYSTAGWETQLLALQAEGAPLRSTVTPAMAEGPDGRLYLVTGDPDPLPGTGPLGRIHFYSQGASGSGLSASLSDEELAGLSFEDGTPDLQHVPWARPALAAVPHLDGKGQPLSDGRGYLALWWIRDTRTRYLWTWGRLDKSGASFTLGRWHHYEAYGYTDAPSGTSPALVLRSGNQLAALLPQASFTAGKVRHVPHADGIPGTGAVVFRDYDDRPALSQGLCPSLNPGCTKRCKRLTDPCAADKSTKSTGGAETDIKCALPRWPAAPQGGQ